MAARILVIEDEVAMRKGLTLLLRSRGYDVIEAANGPEGLVKAQQAQPSLVLLDVMLPGLSGFDVLKHLRGAGVTTPVLMLTAKGAELDKVQAFALGTDDYVTKPFSSLELLGRIEALLRRCAAPLPTLPAKQQWGAFTIDVERLELLLDGLPVDVPPRAVELLGVLAGANGAVVSRETLCETLWGEGGGSTRTIDNLVVKLRKAIELDADKPRVLLTVHGRGYRLEPDP